MVDDGLHSRINTLSRVVNAPRNKGLRSELRRSGPTAPGTAFWQLAVRHIDPDGTELHPSNIDRIRRWQTILWGLALLGPNHRPNRSLGKAMAAAHVSEARLNRLLRASPDQLRGEMRRIIAQLLSAGESADGVDLAFLTLTAGTASEEKVRNRIARDYFQSTRSNRG